MKDTPLNHFVERIMRVGNGIAGFSGAATGIIGSITSNDQVVNNLRRDTLDFAKEYSSPSPDIKKLFELSGRVEGSLQAIHLFNGLAEKELDDIIHELDTLTDADIVRSEQ
jgi:hypothetical protein